MKSKKSLIALVIAVLVLSVILVPNFLIPPAAAQPYPLDPELIHLDIVAPGPYYPEYPMVSQQWDEIYPTYMIKQYHIDEFIDMNQVAGIQEGDKIALSLKPGMLKQWYDVEFVAVTMHASQGVMNKTLEWMDAPLWAWPPPPGMIVGSRWHMVWPAFSIPHTILSWIDANTNDILDPCDIVTFDAQPGPWHVDVVKTDLIVSLEPVLPKPFFWIDPPTARNTTGPTVTVKIMVAGAPAGTQAWQVNLGFTKTVLNILSYTQGTFLSNVNTNTTFVYTSASMANLLGYTVIGCTLPGGYSASGDGWLCSVTFNVISASWCVLNLYNTALIDTAKVKKDYPNRDSFFRATTAPICCDDLAILKVAPKRTETQPLDPPVPIFVDIKNEGDHAATANVEVYADKVAFNSSDPDQLLIGDEYVIGVQPIALAAGEETLLTFNWVTAAVLPESYYISAQITGQSTVEDDPHDNWYVDNQVAVRVDHDISVDAVVTNTTKVAQGGKVTITVTVTNEGKNAETFSLTVNANAIVVGTQPGLNLAAYGGSAVYSFEWTTTGVPAGDYVISATATITGPADGDPLDNTLADGIVHVGVYDLAIVDVIVINRMVTQGHNVGMFFIITNHGSELVSFSFEINATYVGTQKGIIDGSGFGWLDAQEVECGAASGALAPGESYSFYVSWPTIQTFSHWPNPSTYIKALGNYTIHSSLEIVGYTDVVPGDNTDNAGYVFIRRPSDFVASATMLQRTGFEDMGLLGGSYGAAYAYN